ncbi:MAG: molybdopterin cofactor-binding domain-containing protein [Nocardioides sp.]
MADLGTTPPLPATPGVGRRTLLGYVLAAPILAVAVDWGLETAAPASAAAAIPTLPGVADLFDLSDAQTAAAMPTSHLISMELRTDGTVHFALPRMEVGQGITTSTAMIIADEMDIPVEKVVITLADARPELVMNQLTGGSNTTMSTYYPIRTAAAIARGRLLKAASLMLGGLPVSGLVTLGGEVIAPDGTRLSYGSLSKHAAATSTTAVKATLKPDTDLKVVGRPHNRIDAHAAITGEKTFTMDLHVPGALPTMVCRPPTINGKVKRVKNAKAVLRMPGVTHVATIPTGVAVRARTFGQCIDAVRALRVDWTPGLVGSKSDADITAELKAAEIPLVVPDVPLVAKSIDSEFWFAFAGNSALETNCAIADVRKGRAEIWGGFKAPIVAQSEIAAAIGLPASAVTVHCVNGGGSFGRKLFHDAATEAAQASKRMGVPVKLMWHRADDARQGRVHPMSIARTRATVLLGEVLTYEQRHTSVRTEFSHGFGDVITAAAGHLPVGDFSLAQFIYLTSQSTHYDFGVTTQMLDEVETRAFNTGAMRNIYSPNTAVARELTVDKIAKAVGKDPYDFRMATIKDPRSKAALQKVATVGKWGRAMPAGHAQGLGIHNEYHGFSACLVEIDTTPATVNRRVRDAVTGPRVTKVVFAVDVGLVVNPRGLEAQMMGGIMDGIALALTSSLHLTDGHFQEASWDNYAYTREWNVPFAVEIVIMPSTGSDPGGAGELGVAAAFAATAAAYARAVGKMPTRFPINHDEPLFFTPKPTVPPVPASPTNGLHRY